MRGLTFEKPINRYSLSECYTNFLTILRIYRTTMILFKEKFGYYPFEKGINFIGVSGKDNSKPFITFAKFLNLKWYILSDGDNTTEEEVKRQISESFGTDYFETLFVLDNLDFESYILKHGYSEEIIAEINKHK